MVPTPSWKLILLSMMLLSVLSTPAPPKSLHKLVGDRYKIGELLGHGKTGIVYKGIDIYTSREIALKFGNSSTKRLHTEYKIYKITENISNVPRAYYFGHFDSQYDVLAVELFAEDMRFYIPPFSQFNGLALQEVYRVAVETLTAFEGLHNIGLCHKDVKPANLAYGLQQHPSGKKTQKSVPRKIYLCDFDAVKPWMDRQTKQPYPEGTVEYLISRGTTPTNFTPLNLIKGMPYSRRDDLLALGYSLVHLAGHSLPWRCKDATHKRQLMEKLSATQVAKGTTSAFRKYFTYVYDSLNFTSTPDYSLLRSFFLEDSSQNLQSVEWLPLCNLHSLQ